MSITAINKAHYTIHIYLATCNLYRFKMITTDNIGFGRKSLIIDSSGTYKQAYQILGEQFKSKEEAKNALIDFIQQNNITGYYFPDADFYNSIKENLPTNI